MHPTIAVASSLTSLGLVSAIYYCNILSQPSSRLRGETTAMTLLSLIAGFVPLAIACTMMSLWKMTADGLSATDLGAGFAVLVSLAALAATEVVFRRAVRATNQTQRTPDNFTPLTPRPANSEHKPSKMTRAA